MRCSSSYIVSRCCWLLTIAVSLLFVKGSVYAQESSSPDALSLEELLNSKVYSASKYEQREVEAPSSISVISGDEIRSNGYRTLYEALRSVTGFYTKNHGSYSTLGVRGFAPPGDSNSRILLLVNGHTINNNIDGSAPLGSDFPIDMDLIDRIEIVRGPSSSLYGANAFFGVVNIIIRTGNNRGTVISGEAGSLGTYKETATYSLDRRGTQALFSASYWIPPPQAAWTASKTRADPRATMTRLVGPLHSSPVMDSPCRPPHPPQRRKCPPRPSGVGVAIRPILTVLTSAGTLICSMSTPSGRERN